MNLLDPRGAGGDAAARDMQARAWVVVADCRRHAADLQGALEAIAEAWRCNDEGTGDPLEKVRILASDAGYTAAVGELETALSILEGGQGVFGRPPTPSTSDLLV